MTAFPTPEPGPGATNTPNPDPSAIPSGNDGSGQLRAEEAMAQVMDPNAHDDGFPMNPDRRVERLDSALAHAIAAVEAGYRLVSENDATVDRVAAELADVDGYLWPEDGEEEAAAQAGLSCTIANVDHYRLLARAAVRALREAGQ